MTTLHTPPSADLSPEQRSVLEQLAKRHRTEPDEVPLLFRSLVHWPEYMRAMWIEGRYGFHALSDVPQLTKESIHVAVSMVNKCDY